MEGLAQITFHRFPVSAHRLRHGWCRLARRCKQRFDETDGLIVVQLDLVALADNLAGHLASMGNHESRHRAPLQGSCSLEKLLIRRRNSRNESLGFRFFRDRIHVRNVCPAGTHCKSSLASLVSGGRPWSTSSRPPASGSAGITFRDDTHTPLGVPVGWAVGRADPLLRRLRAHSASADKTAPRTSASLSGQEGNRSSPATGSGRQSLLCAKRRRERSSGR